MSTPTLPHQEGGSKRFPCPGGVFFVNSLFRLRGDGARPLPGRRDPPDPSCPPCARYGKKPERPLLPWPCRTALLVWRRQPPPLGRPLGRTATNVHFFWQDTDYE